MKAAVFLFLLAAFFCPATSLHHRPTVFIYKQSESFARVVLVVKFDRVVADLDLSLETVELVLQNVILEEFGVYDQTGDQVGFHTQFDGYYEQFRAVVKWKPYLNASAYIPAYVTHDLNYNVNWESENFTFSFPHGRPKVTLELLSKNYTHAQFKVSFDRLVFGFDPHNGDLELHGADVLSMVDISRAFNASSGEDRDLVPTEYLVDIRFTDNHIIAWVPENVAADDIGWWNLASNDTSVDGGPLRIDFWRGHNAMGGVNISGAYVPWGETVCIAEVNPVNISEPFESCYHEICSEGGCFIKPCEVYIFNVWYAEENDQVFPVPRAETGLNAYANGLWYDNQFVYMEDHLPGLEPGGSTTHSMNFTWATPEYADALTWIPTEPVYWGGHYQTAVTEGDHTLELRLDINNTNITGGTVTIRYCGFENVFCSCGWYLEPSKGVSTPGGLWEWDAPTQCVTQDTTTTVGDVIGLQMNFSQIETMNMFGEAAYEQNLTAPHPDFTTQLNVTIPFLTPSTVNVITEGPLEMQAGDTVQSTGFLPLLRVVDGATVPYAAGFEDVQLSKELAADISEETFEVKLFMDVGDVLRPPLGAVWETRNFTLTFSLCFYADLEPSPGLQLVGANETRNLTWGSELCLLPSDTEEGVVGGPTPFHLRIVYTEVNTGVEAAVGQPAMDVNGFAVPAEDQGWKNAMLWDGYPLATHVTRGPLLTGESATSEFLIQLDQTFVDDRAHELTLFLDYDNTVPYLNASGRPHTEATRPTTSPLSSPPPPPPPPPPLPECYNTWSGVDYVGHATVSENNWTCLEWTIPPLSGPDQHYYYLYPYLKQDANYCRNPDGDVRP
ncbi:hypothetical protein CYMTET_9682, partial [Cymbomonas tetramitiformis]